MATTSSDTTKNGHDAIPAIPGFKSYDKPVEIQLDREVYSVDVHGKQDIHGFMLGVQRMSPKSDVKNPKPWFALVIRLTKPLLKDGKKDEKLAVGKDVYVGGVKLQELYTMATDPQKVYHLHLRPTEKIAFAEGKGGWGFDAKLTGEVENGRQVFGPAILPAAIKGAPQLGAGGGQGSSNEELPF